MENSRVLSLVSSMLEIDHATQEIRHTVMLNGQLPIVALTVLVQLCGPRLKKQQWETPNAPQLMWVGFRSFSCIDPVMLVMLRITLAFSLV